MSKYKYNIDYFSKIDTDEKAYWLGFLYADGCINRYYTNEKLRSMTLELSLCYKDRNHLEKFIKALESNIPIKDRISKCNGKEYKTSRIQLNNTKLCKDLCNLGCIPRKTYDIKFPTFDIVPKEYMRDFIRGFFDGDGCISITEMSEKPHIVLVLTGMSDMLQSMSDFLLYEGIIRKHLSPIKDKRREYVYSLRFYGTDTNKEILDYLYSNSSVYLDRKYQQYIDFYKNYNPIQKRGVYWHKGNKAYIATIYINGKHIRIGQYKNLKDAIEARKEAEKMKYSQMPA